MGSGEPEEGDAASTSGCGLAGNLDVLTCRAEWLYHCGAHQVPHLTMRFGSTTKVVAERMLEYYGILQCTSGPTDS